MKNVAEDENFSLEELSGQSELIPKNFSSFYKCVIFHKIDKFWEIQDSEGKNVG